MGSRPQPRLSGDFGRFRCPEVTFSYDTDVQFAELLLALAGDYRQLQPDARRRRRAGLGRARPLELPQGATASSALSIVEPTTREHRTLGQLVRRCAEELGRDTLFLASGDLSHALIHGAPAPYDPRGKLFDDEVVSFLGSRRLPRPQAASSPSCSTGAAECGLRSLVALGASSVTTRAVDPEMLSYEGPYGVGYLVARFGPAPAVPADAERMSDRTTGSPTRSRVRPTTRSPASVPTWPGRRAAAAAAPVLRAAGGVLRHPQEARRAARLHRHAGAGGGRRWAGRSPATPTRRRCATRAFRR